MVVVSAIGRAGSALTTDTLVANCAASTRRCPQRRELDLMMAVARSFHGDLAQMRALGYQATVTGSQAGIVTDEVFGDARNRHQPPVISTLEGIGGGRLSRRHRPAGRGDHTLGAAAATPRLRAGATAPEAIEIYTDVPA